MKKLAILSDKNKKWQRKQGSDSGQDRGFKNILYTFYPLLYTFYPLLYFLSTCIHCNIYIDVFYIETVQPVALGVTRMRTLVPLSEFGTLITCAVLRY